MKLPSIIVAVFLAMAASAGATGDGGTESPFAFGTGARELALAGADLTGCRGTAAPLWNPARLARSERMALSGFHARLFDSDVAYQYLGFVAPTLDFGTFGLGVSRLGVGGIEERTADNFLLGEIEDKRLGVYAAYGRLLSGYEIGLAATLEHHSLGEYSTVSSPGVNLAVGRRFEPKAAWVKSLAFAAVVRNVMQPSLQLFEESVTHPLSADLGLSVGLIPISQWGHLLTLSAKMSKTDKVDTRSAFGAEYSIRESLHLRGGVRDGRWSLGVGLQIRSFSFDYALVDRNLGSIHTFSLTAAIGLATGEKRARRIKKREAEFNHLMDTRLESQNQQMIEQLVDQGKESFDSGDLVQATRHFDRALFLARTTGIDTVRIHDLALSARGRLEEVSRLSRYIQHMDSSEAKLRTGDFVAAHYFAGQALVEQPESHQAQELLQRADSSIAQIAARDDLLRTKLLTADSLLGFGKTEEALTVLHGLSEFAPDDHSVRMALKRAAFEQMRQAASDAYAQADFPAATSALDSALSLFPDHRSCLDLQKRIERRTATAPAKRQDSVEPEPLSPQLEREVNEAYRAAQGAFEAGDLKAAITGWEKVERLAPDFQSVREYLVNAYKFVGVELYGQSRLEEAATTWGKAILLSPGNEEITDYIKRVENEMRMLRKLSYEP